jgi:L-cysteine/cystine lyase
VHSVLEREANAGRGDGQFFAELVDGVAQLRRRAADLMGALPGEIALTGSTTDGVNAILTALDLKPGDEIVTSDAEHPGLTAPLAVAKLRRGVELKPVPFDQLLDAVTPQTRLIACSHVSWIDGRMVDAPALAATGVPVLLDGAQGLGAVPVDVKALGCDFYAASGQKWLCGPNGSGYLYANADRADELSAPWPGYPTLASNEDPLAPELHADARMLDTGFPAGEHVAWALAALDTLEAPGLDVVQRRAAALARTLAERLVARGLTVAPRGESTLVSFEVDDPKQTVLSLHAQGVVVRDLPGTGYVRASVGGWTNNEDLDRLVAGII